MLLLGLLFSLGGSGRPGAPSCDLIPYRSQQFLVRLAMFTAPPRSAHPTFPPYYLYFLVILPPLLYVAAWQTSWREFKYNLVSISSLAVLLVFFTAFGVAFAAQWWLPGFNWQLGFLLGAVVSPTDAVAATHSIARKVGMPQRVVDLLEGESLLGDAAGLLALEFGVEMVMQGTAPT